MMLKRILFNAAGPREFDKMSPALITPFLSHLLLKSTLEVKLVF